MFPADCHGGSWGTEATAGRPSATSSLPFAKHLIKPACCSTATCADIVGFETENWPDNSPAVTAASHTRSRTGDAGRAWPARRRVA